MNPLLTNIHQILYLPLPSTNQLLSAACPYPTTLTFNQEGLEEGPFPCFTNPHLQELDMLALDHELHEALRRDSYFFLRAGWDWMEGRASWVGEHLYHHSLLPFYASFMNVCARPAANQQPVILTTLDIPAHLPSLIDCTGFEKQPLTPKWVSFWKHETLSNSKGLYVYLLLTWGYR